MPCAAGATEGEHYGEIVFKAGDATFASCGDKRGPCRVTVQLEAKHASALLAKDGRLPFAFAERLLASVPRGRGPAVAWLDARANVVAIAGDRPVEQAHVDAALRTEDAAGATQMGLRRFEEIGRAILEFQRLRTARRATKKQWKRAGVDGRFDAVRAVGWMSEYRLFRVVVRGDKVNVIHAGKAPSLYAYGKVLPKAAAAPIVVSLAPALANPSKNPSAGFSWTAVIIAAVLSGFVAAMGLLMVDAARKRMATILNAVGDRISRRPDDMEFSADDVGTSKIEDATWTVDLENGRTLVFELFPPDAAAAATAVLRGALGSKLK